MMIKMASSRKTNMAFATLAHSPACEDTGKDVTKYRYTTREAALRRLAIRLGMTEDDMELYLGIRRRTALGGDPEG